MHVEFSSIDNAFKYLVEMFHERAVPRIIEQQSRNGKVLRLNEPIIITHLYPQQMVLFNSARDCNPFFHVFEGLWMLAGRSDVHPLAYYVPSITQYSDNGETLNGAYGDRWREYYNYDQLDVIIKELNSNTQTRRCVLQMWSGGSPIVSEPTGSILESSDLLIAIDGSKDVPCNLCIVFEIVNSLLNMTVYNRSNDLILGCLGANYVHMSMLLKYVAMSVGVGVGVYNQVTNNLHAYIEHESWKPEEYLKDETANFVCFVNDEAGTFEKDTFDKEVKQFIDIKHKLKHPYRSRFLQDVARPMMKSFELHKQRLYPEAFDALQDVKHANWRAVCMEWIRKRRDRYYAKSGK